MAFRSMLRSPLPALALLCFVACAAPNVGGSRPSSSSGPKASGQSKGADGLLAKENEHKKLQRDIEAAELDLRLATLEAEAQRQAAALKVEGAQRASFAARDELSSYREVESAKQRAEVQLRVDRSVSRLEAERADLQGILDIYRDEEEARAKDEIIRRHQQSVAFTERELEQSRSQARLVLEFEVPRKTEALEWALQKAEAEQAAAERAQERAELKGRLDVTRKESSLADLRGKLELAARALAKLNASGGSKE